MAKKSKPRSLKKLRQALIGNCEAHRQWLSSLRLYITVGTAAADALAAQGGQAAGSSSATGVTGSEGDISLTSGLTVPVQAGLIQEWHIFLDLVFRNVILRRLETGQAMGVPAVRLDLVKIEPGNLTAVRESIARAASEAFSYLPYEQRLDILCKIFGAKKDTREALFLRKHVDIRNLYQHNRGVVKQEDIVKRGGKPYDILQSDRSTKAYGAGDKIELTLSEIDKLIQMIVNFSKNFEVIK